MTGLLAGSLVVSGAGVVVGATGADAADRKAEPKPVTEVADAFAARDVAAKQDSRVLITDATTPTTKTWALPNGSFESSISNGPVRFKDDDGEWTDIDPTLTFDDDGDVVPAAYPTDLSFSGGGSAGTKRTLLRTGSGKNAIAWQWKGDLPKPTLSANRATYVDVQPGVDLVLEARRTGVEQFYVVRERPAKPLKLETPLALGSNIETRTTKSGAVEYRTRPEEPTARQRAMVDGKELPGLDKGTVVATTPRPAMWSATAEDPTRPTAAPVVIDADLVPTDPAERSANSEPTGDDEGVLAVTPDEDYLADPDTQYPVVIDPTVNLGYNLYDTFVMKASPTYSGGADTYLPIGTFYGDASRSFMNWDVSSIRGKVVSSATLNLYNTATGSPTPTWQIWRTGTASSSTTWNNQPTWTAQDYTTTATNGSTAGWLNTSVTTTAQAWAAGSSNTVGMGLRRSPETGGSTATMVFNSMNGTFQVPYINVTYNSYPNTPGTPSAAPSVLAAGTNYVSTLTPQLRAMVSDPDGGSLHANFTVKEGATTIISSGTGSTVTSGGTSVYTVPASTLVDGHTYTVTAKGHDGSLASSSSSASWTFKVDVTAATQPLVSSTSFTAGAWTGSVVASAPFTFATTSSVAAWVYDIDGGTPVVKTASSNSQIVTVATPAGWHTLTVYATDAAGNLSTGRTFSFGNGQGGMSAPNDGAITDGLTPLDANGPYAATNVRFKYRYAGSGSAFTDIPAGDVTNNGGALTWPVTAAHPDSNRATAPQASGQSALAWDVGQTIPSGTDKALLEVQAVFTNGGTTYTTNTTTVTLDRNAAGSNFATESAGPCSVNLRNGSCTVDAGDVSAFGMSVGRTYDSKTPDVAGAFGPGWKTALPDGPSISDADTFVTVTETGGDLVSFTRSGTTYSPAVGSEGTLTKSAAGGVTTYTYTRLDGSKAVFSGTTPGSGPTTTAPWEFKATSSEDAATSSTTKYTWSGGNLTQITAPLPAGVSSTCTAGTWTAGCRALLLSYNANNQIEKITLKTVDNSTGAAKTVDLACYKYETTAPYRLSKAWDPRTASANCDLNNPVLETTYGYDTASGHPGRLQNITPPGLQPWYIHYDDYTNSSSAIRAAKVDYVSRQHSGGGSTEATSFVYNAPIGSTTGANYPALSASERATWGQTQAPLTATAVFDPGYSPSSTDLRDATVYALDVNGRTVNEASYSGTGQAGWKITTTTYDKYGNTTATLSALNREKVQAGSCGSGALTGCTRAQLADALSDVSHYSADGTDLLETFGPVVSSTYSSTGGVWLGSARTHTKYTYGTGDTTNRELDGPEHAVTVTTVGASLSGLSEATNETDIRTTTNAYGLSGSDYAGWTLKKPMRVTLDMGGGGNDIVKETRYNEATGDTIETRQPLSAGSNSNSPGTTTFSFYTAGTENIAGCVKTAWAGLPCKQGPAAQPTNLGKLPIKQTTNYDFQGRPTTVTETFVDASANTHVRTTTTTYDGPSGIAARTASTAVTGSTGAVGTSLPAVANTYHASTGLLWKVGGSSDPNLGGDMISLYDDFGRITSYTDADGAETTTTYDSHGNESVITNKSGSTTINTATFGYDGGNEHRHIKTSITYGNGVGTYTGTFNADGALTLQTLPDGTEQYFERDNLSRPNWVYYSSNMFFRDDVVYYTAHGQIATENGYTVASSRKNSYDKAGRLTSVQETRAGQCTTRTYTFDQNSNRGLEWATPPDTGGVCSTTTSANYAKYVEFDSADRPVADYWFSIDHDELNRVKLLPGLSTQNGTDTSFGYYVNDMNRTMTQGSTVRTWTLDPAGRDRKATISTSSAATLNHYSDGSSDSPDWTQETSSTGSTSQTTYNTDLNGQLASVTSNAGGSTPAIQYQITNVHGDVTNTYDPSSGALSGTMDPDEYGRMRDSTGASAVGAKYGWLGGKQRAAEVDSGLIRMGVRIYSPTLGIFLQTDPVLGGNAGPYTYVSDPIGSLDLDGRWGIKITWKGVGTALQVGLGAAAIMGCVACGAALAVYSGYQAYRSARRGDWGGAAWNAASVATFGWGVRARAGMKAASRARSAWAAKARSSSGSTARRYTARAQSASRAHARWRTNDRAATWADYAHYSWSTMDSARYW